MNHHYQQQQPLTELHVVFMGIDSNDGLAAHTRVAATWTNSPWTHCELYFPAPLDETFTIDIHRRCVYSMRGSRGLRPGWQTIVCMVSSRQLAAAYQHCCAARGAAFNTASYYGYLCGPSLCYENPMSASASASSKRTYICARLVAEALQAAEVMSPDIDDQQVNVGHVYREVAAVGMPLAMSQPAAAAAAAAATGYDASDAPQQYTAPAALPYWPTQQQPSQQSQQSQPSQPSQQQRRYAAPVQRLVDSAAYARGAVGAALAAVTTTTTTMMSSSSVTSASASRTSTTPQPAAAAAAAATTAAAASGASASRADNIAIRRVGAADADDVSALASYLNKTL